MLSRLSMVLSLAWLYSCTYDVTKWSVWLETQTELADEIRICADCWEISSNLKNSNIMVKTPEITHFSRIFSSRSWSLTMVCLLLLSSLLNFSTSACSLSLAGPSSC